MIYVAYEACEHGRGMSTGPSTSDSLMPSHHKSEAVRKRSIWESYAGMYFPYRNTILSSLLVLPPKTRLNISLALCAVAIAGIVISDRLEQAMPPPPKAAPNQS